MSLNLLPDSEYGYVLDRNYNIEYELGNGKRRTFSNILRNVDGTYFWFCSEEEGMDVIRQDKIITMTCIRKSL